jgi:hypothetical protein
VRFLSSTALSAALTSVVLGLGTTKNVAAVPAPSLADRAGGRDELVGLALASPPPGNTFPVPRPYRASVADSWHACRDGCRRLHKGNDIFAAEGAPAVAVESGVIAKVDGTDDGNGGLSLWLLGDSGVAYYYAHNAQNLVTAGQRVERGQVIARVGRTGNARTTPAHIHFQVNLCGHLTSSEPCTTDPHRYLQAWQQHTSAPSPDGVGLFQPDARRLDRVDEHGTPLAAVSLPAVSPDARPIAGDWDGDGTDSVGIYNPKTARFDPRGPDGRPGPTTTLRAPAPGAVPLAGDWDGDGVDTLTLHTPPDATSTAVAGDWDGDGRDTIVLVDPTTGTVALVTPGDDAPDDVAPLPGALPLAGDWDGDGRDTVALYDPATTAFHLGDRTVAAHLPAPATPAALRKTSAGRARDEVPVPPAWGDEAREMLVPTEPDAEELVRLRAWIDEHGPLDGTTPEPADPPAPPVPVAGDWNGPEPIDAPDVPLLDWPEADAPPPPVGWFDTPQAVAAATLQQPAPPTTSPATSKTPGTVWTTTPPPPTTAPPTDPTVPTVPPTDPTVPPTDPIVPPTDPTVPPTDPTVPPTDPTVPPTDPTVPLTDPTVPPDPTTTTTTITTTWPAPPTSATTGPPPPPDP